MVERFCVVAPSAVLVSPWLLRVLSGAEFTGAVVKVDSDSETGALAAVSMNTAVDGIGAGSLVGVSRGCEGAPVVVVVVVVVVGGGGVGSGGVEAG